MKHRPRAPGQETDLAIGGLVRVGVVESVNLEKATAIVLFGKIKSPPLQWVGCAGKLSLWSPPSEQEQVLVIVPDNDIEQGVILGGLFSTSNPAAETTLKLVLKYLDGALASFDPESNELNIRLAGKMILSAEEGFELTGDFKLTGDVDITGDMKLTGDIDVTGDAKVSKTLTADTDVVGAGKSLKGHKHLGVQTGAGISGAPQ